MTSPGCTGVLHFLLLFLFVAAANAAQNNTCQKIAPCDCKQVVTIDGTEESIIDCSDRALSDVPNFLVLTGMKFDALLLHKNPITRLPGGAFAGLDVRRIDISNTRLQSFSNDAFHRVKGLEVLVIENSRMSSVPVAFHALSSLSELRLANNNIRKLPLDAFDSMTKLEHLDLRQNQIEITRTFTSFRNLKKLKYVNLADNGLPIYPDMALRQSANITNLILRNNRIRYIPMEAFQNKTKLTELDLEGNPLTFSDTKAALMPDLPKLKRLALGGCNLETISSKSFQVIRLLRNLTIRECKVHNIPKGAFRSLKHLKFLDVSWNPFPLTRDVFHGIEGRLDTLKLEKMNLSEVPHRILNAFPRLRDIYLAGNNIVTLPARLFAGFHQHNTRVYLDDNKIKRVSKRLMDGAKRPMGLFLARNKIANLDFISKDPCQYDKMVVDLSGNPIKCDCETYRMVQKKIMDLRGTCASPEEYTNQKLMWNPQVGQELEYFENNVNATGDCLVRSRIDQRLECTCQQWLDFDSPKVCAVAGSVGHSQVAIWGMVLSLTLGFTCRF